MANLSNINNKFIVSDVGHVSIGNVTTNTYLVHAKSSGINNAILALESSSWSAGASAELRLSYVAGHERSIKGGYATGLEFYTNNATPAIAILPGGSASGATGNVGIGTDSPGALLQVGDAPTSSSQQGARIYGYDGALSLYTTRSESNFNTALYLYNDPTGGAVGTGTGIMFRANSDTTSGQQQATVYSSWTTNTHASRTAKLVFQTCNAGTVSDKMTILGSGNVGIGTGSASPIEKLQVVGQVISTGSNSTSATAGAERAIMDLSGFSATDHSARFGHFRGTNSAGAGQLRLYTDSVERVRIDANGNVGIGTDLPVGKLQVSLPAYTNEDTNSQQAIFGVDSGYGVRIGYNETDNKGYINVLKPGVAWGSLILQEDVGNVGIGTVSPNQQLTLGGADGTQTLSFTTSAYLGDQAVIGNIEFSTHDADVGYRQLANIYALKTGTNTNSGDITFWTKRNGARSEKIRIESTGDLRVKEGSIVIDNTSQGIFLGGTASENKLSFYKEGSWTPEIYYQNATDQGGASNVVSQGKFTKIGNLVFISFRLDFSQSVSSPVADNIGVKNLPFNSANNHFNGGGNVVTSSSIVGLMLQTPTAGSNISILNTSNNTGNFGNDFGSGTGKYIRGSMTYLAQ